MRPPPTRNRWCDRLTVVAFVAAIAVPFGGASRGEAHARDEKLENRRMAPRPQVPSSLDQWRTFPTQLGAWFDDHVGFRHEILNWRSRLYVFGGNTSPAKLVELGRDGWYFHTDGDRFDDWRGVRPFSRDDLDAWRGALERRASWLDARGIAYVFALCPNKEWVYPEHFPRGFERVGRSRLEQLAETLRESPGIDFLDLRAALLAEKAHDRKDDYAYHRLGTHWTDRGAFAGASAIVDTLRTRGRPVPRLEREDYTSRVAPEAPQDSMGDQLYLDEVVREPIHRLEPRERRATEVPFDAALGIAVRHWTNPDRSLPKVVLVHDSFGPWLAPILAESCSELWTTASTPRNATLIAEVRPDVVVQMYTERVLRQRAILTALNGELIDPSTRENAAETVWSPTSAEFAAALTSHRGITIEPDTTFPSDDSRGQASLRLTTGREGGTCSLRVPAGLAGRPLALRLCVRTRSISCVRLRDETATKPRLLASVLTSPRDRDYVVALGGWSGVNALSIELEPDTSLVVERVELLAR